MKKLAILAAASALFAAPAFAASITISFEVADGTTTVATFDQASMTATGADGSTSAYTYDEAKSEICVAAQEICVVFDTKGEAPSVGMVSGFTASNGDTGTATVTAMTE